MANLCFTAAIPPHPGPLAVVRWVRLRGHRAHEVCPSRGNSLRPSTAPALQYWYHGKAGRGSLSTLGTSTITYASALRWVLEPDSGSIA